MVKNSRLYLLRALTHQTDFKDRAETKTDCCVALPRLRICFTFLFSVSLFLCTAHQHIRLLCRYFPIKIWGNVFCKKINPSLSENTGYQNVSSWQSLTLEQQIHKSGAGPAGASVQVMLFCGFPFWFKLSFSLAVKRRPKARGSWGQAYFSWAPLSK